MLGQMKILFLCFFIKNSSAQFKKVKLKDVDVLTLYQGRQTNGRRSSPVMQLQCKGGTAGCGKFIPEVVQCYNRGSDGLDVQWECKADMDSKYRFGRISVSCEGFDYPEDPYVLAGSCGLEYTIDLTEEGKSKESSNWSSEKSSFSKSSYSSNKSEDEDYTGIILFAIIVICIICVSHFGSGNNGQIPPAGSMDDGIPPAGSHSAPPPYNPGHSYTRSSRPSGWRPGFWSGFGLGNLTGNWFGSSNRGYGNRGYTRHSNQSAYNAGYTDGARSSPSPRRSSSPSRSSSSTRTASGFGGTTRR